MKSWYECKVSYLRAGDEGLFTKATESYFVDAENFTETEAIITEKVSPFSSGEFSVIGIKKLKITELFLNNEGDRWYKCKVMMIIIDEEKQKERELACSMILSSYSIEEALANLNKNLANSMSDYRIVSILELSIIDVIPYTPNSNTKEEKEEI